MGYVEEKRRIALRLQELNCFICICLNELGLIDAFSQKRRVLNSLRSEYTTLPVIFYNNLIIFIKMKR